MLATHDRNRRISRATFDYHRCAECGVISLFPVPADLGRYYPADYIDLRRDGPMRRTDVEQYKLDLVLRFVQHGKLLEIGPGAGGFLELAQSAGFEVEAVEQDESTCRYLERALGARTYCTADPASAVRQGGRYDVVALWHSLEHLPDPGDMLLAAAGALAPGGAVVVATPNPTSLQIRVLRSRWTHLDAPATFTSSPGRHPGACGTRRAEPLHTDIHGRRDA